MTAAKIFAVTPELAASSMANLDYTTRAEQAEIQEVIDYVAAWLYQRTLFSADILLEQSYFRSGIKMKREKPAFN